MLFYCYSLDRRNHNAPTLSFLLLPGAATLSAAFEVELAAFTWPGGMALPLAADIRAVYGQAQVAITTATASNNTCMINANVSTGAEQYKTS